MQKTNSIELTCFHFFVFFLRLSPFDEPKYRKVFAFTTQQQKKMREKREAEKNVEFFYEEKKS
jgi:hypothetical protein